MVSKINTMWEDQLTALQKRGHAILLTVASTAAVSLIPTTPSAWGMFICLCQNKKGHAHF